MGDMKVAPVERWCGFEILHPPHLYGGQYWTEYGPVITIYPCPGKPFPEEDSEEG